MLRCCMQGLIHHVGCLYQSLSELLSMCVLALAVEEEKDEAIEAQKEKAKEQIDEHSMPCSLIAQF